MEKENNYPKYDFGEVLNLYSCRKEVCVLNLVVPTGFIKVSRTSNNSIRIRSTKDIVKQIDKFCAHGHISWYNDFDYIFPREYTFNLREIGTTKDFIGLKVCSEEYVSIGHSIALDEAYSPFEPVYILKEVDNIKVYL